MLIQRFLFEFTGVEQEFKTIQSFKREGKIGFLSRDKDSQKAEVQLSNLLKSLQITTPGNNYDSYQFGTYGIGGFIDNHLDTYGTPDSPMEDILDLKSGLYCVVFLNIFKGGLISESFSFCPHPQKKVPILSIFFL